MSKRLSKITLICSLVIFVCCMGVMLYYADNKMIVIAGVASDVSSGEDADSRKVTLLTIEHSDDTGEYFTIQMPEGMKPDRVAVENRYMDREIWIYIDRATIYDFTDTKIVGDVHSILSAYLQQAKDGLWIKMQMTGLYECETSLENGTLRVLAGKPKEFHERIAVIDAAENEISKDVAKRVKKRFEDSDIFVYFSGMDDASASPEKRIGLANDAKADFFLHIDTASAEDSDTFGIYGEYNKDLFTPEMDGYTLLDEVIRETVLSTYSTGHKPLPGGDEELLLKNAEVPSAILYIGYTSNPQENLLLQKESYRERIAEGIYNGVCKVYE